MGTIFKILEQYKTYLKSFSLKFEEYGDLSTGYCSLNLTEINKHKTYTEIFANLKYYSRSFKKNKTFLKDLEILEGCTKTTKIKNQNTIITELIKKEQTITSSDFKIKYLIKIIF